jgi:class 3 adenylate cyclase/streptogramin lyase
MPKLESTALRAVLFTDVVGSTELARELGDVRWTRLLSAQRRIIREELKAHRGREVDTAGDGFFVVFESPAEAVRCAFASAGRVQELGLDIRGGVHFGEIETRGNDAHGIVVHTGARVMSQAGAAEVLITQTVKDLVAGARFDVEERATFELKGVPGMWTLFDVVGVDDEPRPPPVPSEEGAERRERATVAGPKRRRRRPWIVAAALILVLVAIGAFLLLRPSPTFVPAAGTVARIDGDRFEQPVAVGSSPLAMTEGQGRVWVMDRASQVYWVNESDGSTGSRGTDGTPTGAAEGGGAVWITNGFGVGGGPDTSVSRLDPVSGQLTEVFTTPIGSQAITYGAGAVWVANYGTGSVTRYDTTSKTTDTIPLSGKGTQVHPDSIAFGSVGGEAVWVGDSLSGRVYRVEADGSKQVFTVGGPPSAIAMGPDAVWVASEHADAIYVLDPDGSVRRTIDVGARGCNAPTSVAIDAGAVWVTCALSQRVMRFDPTSATPTVSLSIAGAPQAVTTAQDGSVWVAVAPR